MDDDQGAAGINAIELATQVTTAWLKNPNVDVSAEDVPAFLRRIHSAIGELSTGAGTAVPAEPEHKPAVPVRSSVKPDYLISLIDGRKFKSLKRHLSSQGLTPAEYRERYGLKSDYPMVAATYSAHRRDVAQRLGLGRKRPAQAIPVPETMASAPPLAGDKAGSEKARRKITAQSKPKLKLKLGSAQAEAKTSAKLSAKQGDASAE
ncbi:MAG: MucR family transcriptional regulator [Rhizorhabdus sp.]|jgi:predicted transcriptional regulator|nr:MucR family transcriptional regulator [Rhizorhabdus sp.]